MDLIGRRNRKESFRIIFEETQNTPLAKLPPAEWKIARRLIHTTADLHIADTLVFSGNPIKAGIEALLSASPIFAIPNDTLWTVHAETAIH